MVAGAMETRNSITHTLPTEQLPHLLAVEQASLQLASTLNVFRSTAGWIFELGIRPDMPFYLKKNLALINRVSFISLFLMLPGSFLLLLVGFDHPLSLLVSGLMALCSILSLNGANRVEWAQALFAFSPAATLLSYTLLELASGSLDDPLTYILARQGLCLSLLIPIIIYGFERSRRGLVLGVCVLIFLGFDVGSMHWGETLVRNLTGMSHGVFAVLSVVQLVGLSACVFYMQGYTMQHENLVRQSNEKLQRMAIRDGMTGLFNHTFMEQLIGDAINRSKRSKNSLALLMIDVDFFKQINDTFGHNTGDEVLTHLAKLLESSKRSTDYLGRWGGDELLLLLTDTNLQGAAYVAQKLHHLVSHHTFPHHRPLTISLGVSEYQGQDTLVEFIGRADRALYDAKHLGRNRVEIEGEKKLAVSS